MINIPVKRIEPAPGKVFRFREGIVFEYPEKVTPLQTSVQINPQDYILVQTGDVANFALSASQQLGNRDFGTTIAESFRIGLPLATMKEFTPHYRDVNLALRGESALYDALGNLIEGDRLIEYGRRINGARVYLNNAYEFNPEDKGFQGLDVISVIGFDGEKPKLSRQPLEQCAVDCWVEIDSPTNSQGYYTQPAPIQRFEKGKTVYSHRPIANCVSWLGADSDRADLGGNGVRRVAYSGLGGFLRAEGTAQKIEEKK